MKKFLKKLKRRLFVKLFKDEMGFVCARHVIGRAELLKYGEGGGKEVEGYRKEIYESLLNHMVEDGIVNIRRYRDEQLGAIVYEAKLVFLKKAE